MLLEIKGTWKSIRATALRTVGVSTRLSGLEEPSSDWKRKMLLAEHSPIRKLIINWYWESLRYWVSVHLVRHKFGIEHFVSSQRPDRNPRIKDRDLQPQGNCVQHEIEANAQEVIYVSRKRLCRLASEETRAAWIKCLNGIKVAEPELYAVCVPDCVYRGHCFELKSCGYHKTETFKAARKAYIKGINE